MHNVQMQTNNRNKPNLVATQFILQGQKFVINICTGLLTAAFDWKTVTQFVGYQHLHTFVDSSIYDWQSVTQFDVWINICTRLLTAAFMIENW